MSARILHDHDGITIRQMAGPAIEIYFDWEILPKINLAEEYYVVEIIPEDSLTPIEIARPNSSGPLHFFLKSAITYRLSLVAVHPTRARFESRVVPGPWCELIPQHENLQKLVWGDLHEIKKHSDPSEHRFTIYVDGNRDGSVLVGSEPEYYVKGRPGSIEAWLDDSTLLFSLDTNLPRRQIKRNLTFFVETESLKLFFSTIVDPASSNRKILAEIPLFNGMSNAWETAFQKEFPDKDLTCLVGRFLFYEDGNQKGESRQYGFCARPREDVISRIQFEEWNLPKMSPVERYRLELQITSAHRELYKFPLIKKGYSEIPRNGIMSFSQNEVDQAKRALFQTNEKVIWDQSFLELVVFFKVEGRDWQEFQREIAHSTKWEYHPIDETASCSVEFEVFDLEEPDNSVVIARSGSETPIPSLNRVALKPYSATRLFACWDIDKQRVLSQIHDVWGCDIPDVGFYLKINEEYLGVRKHRGDLDCQIIDLFGNARNMYFDVEPNKCYSAEIVARHYQKEMALTEVSSSIVTPRKIEGVTSRGSARRRLGSPWFHPSQREVKHREGRDSHNRAKALIHLHMHSPNLFRIEPFRDRYLRDEIWPLRLENGTEVHNPPGEWVYKNCLDSWLPILRSLRKLSAEGVDFQVSMDISPPVAYMLASDRFKDYMSRYLDRVQNHARGQIVLMKARKDDPSLVWAAERYLADLSAIDLFYNHELKKDMIGAFCNLETAGYLEIISCTATHGMAAELQSIPDALSAQVTLAVRSHHRIFGRRPAGIWLAENSYFPGIEPFLEKEGIRYFFVEAEAIIFGSSCPIEEEYNPVIIPGCETVAFGRSRLGRTQVWDAELGYAGHPDFREYHFRHLGIPIKRVTSKTSMDKQPYDPDRAEETARSLAWDFHQKLSERSYELSRQEFKSMPLISCTYDAELFGHHWSEGPLFLEEFLRAVYQSSDGFGLTTPSHYLVDSPDLPDITPNPSTWGHEAVHVRWTDPKVAWTFIEFEKADKILTDYLGYALEGKLSDFQKRLVEQMAAELIRAQSSDLTFVIMSGAFEEDMRREILKYLNYFYRLKHLVDNNIEDEEWLAFRQYENDMFPEIPDYYRIR